MLYVTLPQPYWGTKNTNRLAELDDWDLWVQMISSFCPRFWSRIISRLVASTPTSVTSTLATLRLEWPVPSDLQLEKGGRGWTIRDHQRSSPSNHVQNQVFLWFVNGSYERRSFATILVLTARKRGVWERPYHPEHHSQNPDYVDFAPRPTSTYFSLQRENGVSRKIEPVVLPPLNVLQLENGGLGHRGDSTIAIFIEPLQLDNGGW